MSQTRKLLAHALQLNVRGICLRRRRWAIVDLSGHEAGHGWGTGQNPDKVGSRLVRRDNLGGGNAPGFTDQKETIGRKTEAQIT
jgi:hypothetical protein